MNLGRDYELKYSVKIYSEYKLYINIRKENPAKKNGCTRDYTFQFTYFQHQGILLRRWSRLGW